MFRDAGTGTSAAVYGSKAGVSASATLENGAGWDIGAHGAALKLDGDKNYALAPEMVGNPALKQMTVCVWAKFASTHYKGTSIYRRQYLVDADNHKYYLLVDGVKDGASVKVCWVGGELRSALFVNCSTLLSYHEGTHSNLAWRAHYQVHSIFNHDARHEVYTGEVPIKLNAWNYYCSVRGDRKLQIYVDGTLSKEQTDPHFGQYVSYGKFYVGKYKSHNYYGNYDGAYHVHGSMCSLRVYDRALSKEELRRLWQLGTCDGGTGSTTGTATTTTAITAATTITGECSHISFAA